MMMKSISLGNSNSWSYLLCITKIFDLVSFGKLGFSDINMSAAYTDLTGDSRVTYVNFTGKKTCKTLKTFDRLSHLCKPDDDTQ